MSRLYHHIPVLADECIAGLDIKPGGVYVDGTAGSGGHSARIAGLLTTGRLISIDRDAEAVAETARTLATYADKTTIIRDNFNNIPAILDKLYIDHIDGCLLDLGVSSHQLDTVSRGFSYILDCPLDMRMDDRQALTAAEIVNTYGEEELSAIIYNNGDERHARRIARQIVKSRGVRYVGTSAELVNIIETAVPEAKKKTIR